MQINNNYKVIRTLIEANEYTPIGKPYVVRASTLDGALQMVQNELLTNYSELELVTDADTYATMHTFSTEEGFTTWGADGMVVVVSEQSVWYNDADSFHVWNKVKAELFDSLCTTMRMFSGLSVFPASEFIFEE